MKRSIQTILSLISLIRLFFLMRDVLAWQAATFPERTDETITGHLAEEAGELHANPRDEEGGYYWCAECENEACYGMILDPCAVENKKGISWVIVGGESGDHLRNMDNMEIEWMRDVADECIDAGVAVFIKQDTAPKPGTQGRIPGELWALKQHPENMRLPLAEAV